MRFIYTALIKTATKCSTLKTFQSRGKLNQAIQNFIKLKEIKFCNSDAVKMEILCVYRQIDGQKWKNTLKLIKGCFSWCLEK